MTRMRQRRLRGRGSLLLAALLVVPLLASGHNHAAHRAAPCATCAVTQHAPVASAPVVSVPTAPAIVIGLDPVAAAAPAERAVRQATSRGPPPALFSLGV